MIWRRATSEIGTQPTTNPILTVFTNWQSLGLLVTKPVLHWMFGLSLGAEGFSQPGLQSLISVEWHMRDVQVCISYSAPGCSVRRPQGPQPAAYGHLQTLANLVDEWSPTMWWGHKADGEVIFHAGESFQSFIYCYSASHGRICRH
ncbi:hypothetical protein PILCRDRAFT_78201 [Piloderma croceum F 1598]|uniref:Uncharacterized protein n=1 Tax=Piloderma croceum (strain F 1598) TaxID=765440 RepID=A0A0C3F841_PILCF|nr:hypothetical protein PILCRDRAFT_78201 [Piloderma croceum F 1598]